MLSWFPSPITETGTFDELLEAFSDMSDKFFTRSPGENPPHSLQH